MSNYLNKLKDQVVKGSDVFIAQGAVVIGNVSLGDKVSIWYNAVLRGDSDNISIGNGTNIQDGVVIHVDPGCPVKVGSNCVIGHNAIVHGCSISDHCLIGMGATIMNHVEIGEGSVIGANCLVTENSIIPPYSMVLGVPGKVVKQLPKEVVKRIKSGAEHYITEASKYLENK